MTQFYGHSMKQTWTPVKLRHLPSPLCWSGFEMQVSVAQTGQEGVLSPQLDEPVQDKEDKQAEEQHVAQQFGLTASGQLLHSADGGTEQAAR